MYTLMKKEHKKNEEEEKKRLVYIYSENIYYSCIRRLSLSVLSSFLVPIMVVTAP